MPPSEFRSQKSPSGQLWSLTAPAATRHKVGASPKAYSAFGSGAQRHIEEAQDAMATGPNQTVGDLRRKAIVTDAEIASAIESYLADPKGKPFRSKSGHALDVAAAVEAHRPAKAAVAEKGMREAFRRTMIRTAIILAAPSES